MAALPGPSRRRHRSSPVTLYISSYDPAQGNLFRVSQSKVFQMSMKSGGKQLIRWIVPRLPWGARETLFEALCDQWGPGTVAARVLPRLGKIGLFAEGEYGLIQSAANDTVVLPVYASSGTYGRRTADLVLEFFSREGSGTYLDIGANIGLTTIPIARNPAIRCIAFEPEPVNHGHLAANIGRNCPHGNVELHPVAIFERSTVLKFSLAEDNLGDHRISLGQERHRQTIDIQARPLDDYLGQIQGPLAVKIDTQGAEPFVIAGGREVLAKAALVVMEFSPWLMKVMGSDPEVIFRFLSTFPRLAVGNAEGEAFGAPQSWSEIEPLLRDILQRGGNDGHVYVDVAAFR